MVLFSRSKIFFFGGQRQEKALTSTQYSNDQFILYHLEFFNELLKRTLLSPSLLSNGEEDVTYCLVGIQAVDVKAKKRKEKRGSRRLRHKKVIKAKNAQPIAQRLARSFTIGDAGI